MFRELLPYLEEWFKEADLRGYSIPEDYGACPDARLQERINQTVEEFTRLMKGCYPFHQPDYAGQMLKPPHPVAWLGAVMAMSVNTNNHALDGGPPTSEMEKEVIRDLSGMTGFPKTALGHLTSGGTVANLEALWVARSLHPDKEIFYSADAHYTHSRMCEVLGARHRKISLDASEPDFSRNLEEDLQGAGTLVVTLGTTGRGKIEPLHTILPVCKKLGVRVHVDAAYGGFFTLLKKSGLMNAAPWHKLGEADSIVIDPHKHGLQPYGCGCVLFRDASVGRFYKHDSPYTYFSSEDLHLGEITLECSRAGAAAAALWFTIRCLGLGSDSVFARMLADCIEAARIFAAKIDKTPGLKLLESPETDIVCYYPDAPTIHEISGKSRAVFQDLMQQGTHSLFVSLYKMETSEFQRLRPEIRVDDSVSTVTILRSVLMKPSHKGFAGEMVTRINASLQHIA